LLKLRTSGIERRSISCVISFAVISGGMGTMPWGVRDLSPVNTSKLTHDTWQMRRTDEEEDR
jgi:hypothetical protein